MPTAWLLGTIFAVGVAVDAWAGTDPPARAWAAVGVAGMVMQSAVFAGVEATRLALVAAASHEVGAVAGLWGLHDALFGFNQAFLATALLGLSLARRRGRPLTVVALVGAALLLVSATSSPYGVDGRNPSALLGLVGWLLWLLWIVACSAGLMRGAERPRGNACGPRASRSSGVGTSGTS